MLLNERAELICQATGKPSPQIVWHSLSGGKLPSIERKDLEAFAKAHAAGRPTGEIAVTEMTLDDTALRSRLVGYEGFESIGFHKNVAFLTVETEINDKPTGYLIRADVRGNELVLQEDTLRPLFTQTTLGNLAYEAILVDDDRVQVLYELKGGPNHRPQVLSFDHSLQWKGTRRLKPIEYRITDATSRLADGTFYVMNYHWPGSDWKSESCALAERFGVGATHAKTEVAALPFFL